MPRFRTGWHGYRSGEEPEKQPRHCSTLRARHRSTNRREASNVQAKQSIETLFVKVRKSDAFAQDRRSCSNFGLVKPSTVSA